MNPSFVPLVCALWALAVSLAPLHAQRWQMQYFYDQNHSALTIHDIQFASAERGVAVGLIAKGHHRQPTSLVTSDGGAHWQTVPLKDAPISLFFRNENAGWMVTAGGLWQTAEAGKSWSKLPKAPSPVLRVYFTDENNGWAVGPKKVALETHDGGRRWTAIRAAAEQPGKPEYSVYNWIAFATPEFGIITGWNLPPRRGTLLPDWIDPEEALSRRETPHLSYSLVTHDGGKSWKSASASLFGDVTHVRFGTGGMGLGLIEYSDSFRVPSEVYRIDWRSGKSATFFKDKKYAITDVWLAADGTAYLAGLLQAGQLRHVVPGKVVVLKSKDYATWSEMEVDYRAVANRAMLAAGGDHGMWLATDTGMILKLSQ